MVYDDKLFVGARVQQSTLAKGRYTDHEIDVTLFWKFRLCKPINDVHLSIYQGHRWDNAITNLTPSFVERNDWFTILKKNLVLVQVMNIVFLIVRVFGFTRKGFKRLLKIL